MGSFTSNPSTALVAGARSSYGDVRCASQWNNFGSQRRYSRISSTSPRAPASLKLKSARTSQSTNVNSYGGNHVHGRSHHSHGPHRTVAVHRRDAVFRTFLDRSSPPQSELRSDPRAQPIHRLERHRLDRIARVGIRPMTVYIPEWDLTTIPDAPFKSEASRRTRLKAPRAPNLKLEPCQHCGALLSARQRRRACVICGGRP
jgi:hypothetical protein